MPPEVSAETTFLAGDWIEFLEVAFCCLESLVEKGVLHNHQLDVALGACAAQCRCLLGVQSGSLNQIEPAVFFKGFGNFIND